MLTPFIEHFTVVDIHSFITIQKLQSHSFVNTNRTMTPHIYTILSKHNCGKIISTRSHTFCIITKSLWVIQHSLFIMWFQIRYAFTRNGKVMCERVPSVLSNHG